MGWVQRNNVSVEESRRLFEEHRWLMLSSIVVAVALLMSFPLVLVVIDAPIEIAVPLGLIVMGAFGFGFRVWATRKIEEMRAGGPPDIGGQHGGERPGG
jgi:hypothetical protein